MISPLYHIADVARILGKSKRAMETWLRRNPVDLAGVPFYSPIGRTKTFDDDDIKRIRAANRWPERKPLTQQTIDAHALLPIVTDAFGYVYFIESGDVIKIGHSKKPRDRLTTIRTASPLPLKVLHVSKGDRAKERAIHTKFRHCHSHGEWFYKAPELLAYIDLLKKDGV